MIDKIRLFTLDDDTLKQLGELLANNTSRRIIVALSENQMYKNELSVKLSIPPNLVFHHVEKLERLGLLEIEEKRIAKKGKAHKYYKIKSGIVVLPEKDDEKESSMKRIFKEGVKFACIGLAAFVSWVYSIPELEVTIVPDDTYGDLAGDSPVTIPVEPSNELLFSMLIPILTIVAGMMLKNFLEKLREKNRG